MAEDTVRRNKRQQKWQNEHCDRINMIFSKGLKEKIQAAAAAAGKSQSKWVEEAILEKLSRE